MTLQDFKPSQLEPTLPKIAFSNGAYTCEGCGAQLKRDGEWCGHCAKIYSDTHLAWVNATNLEFDRWYALHQHTLAQTKSKGNGIHVSEAGETTTPEILEGRKKYAKDLIQPFREGVMSKEFVEAYPEQAKKYPKDLVNKAKYVWK